MKPVAHHEAITPQDPGLHMFCLGDMEYIIAKDLEDAWVVFCTETGARREDFDADSMEEVSKEKSLGCWVDAGQPAEHGCGEVLRLSAAAWCKRLGRGIAFSNDT